MTRNFQKYQSRVAFLSIVVLFAWGALGFRLFNIQVLNGTQYTFQGEKQGITKEILPALRGNIYDVNGIPFTRNITHYTIAADPAQIQNKQKIVTAFSQITGKPKSHYLNKLNRNNNFVYLERNLQKKYAQPIIDKNFSGIIVQRHARRSYPQDNIGGQLIGFTNVDDSGLTGIEKIYNEYLSGTNGWIDKQKTGTGFVNVKNNYPKKTPVDGADIHLTINVKYQSVLQKELLKQQKKTDAVSATGVIVNPQTGAILAIASVPDFNPNKPNKAPTKNQKIRASSDQFEPGSTFKIVTATAAIDNNIVKVLDEFDCENGEFQYKSVSISDHKPHKILNFGEIIEQSSNIGIIKIASRVGDNNIYKYAQKYGFGSVSNLGLGSEINGTLRKLSDWSKISLAEIAMGHEVGVTALQLAMAYSAIANGGILLKPYIINNINDITGDVIYSDKPQAVRKVANESVMKKLSKLLELAVESGTGVEASIKGWQVAGKTGTAQKYLDGNYSHTKFVSNFVGYLPANNPQLLCVIVIDEPKMGYHWGGTGAAPVFKRVMQRIVSLDDTIKMPKTNDPNLPEATFVDNSIIDANNNEPVLLSSPANSKNKFAKRSKLNKYVTEVTVPNLKGMSLKKALTTLHNHGLELRFEGSGKVAWQSPDPGMQIDKGSICSIGLE